MSTPLKIALVIPWFGKDLVGGAEQQAWQIVSRLQAAGHIIEVLTTCSPSFLSDWEQNVLPAGLRNEEGISVRRFKLVSTQKSKFHHVNGRLLNVPKLSLKPGVSPISEEEEHVFLHEGISSPDLLHYLSEFERDYNAFIFLPYLFGPILLGLPKVASKAWLLPCLHDEVYAYLPCVERIFCLAKGILFNSVGEFKLAQKIMGPGILPKSIVAGEGVEPFYASATEMEIEVEKLGLKNKNFLLYLGRMDVHKNVPFLVDCYQHFKKNFSGAALELVLAGPGDWLPDNNILGIHILGKVTDVTKAALLNNCRVLVQPSLNESFSRVMGEAWSFYKPVLVPQGCLATSLAVNQCKGGWVLKDQNDWVQTFFKVSTLDPKDLLIMGERGFTYAQEWMSWEPAIRRTIEALSFANDLKWSEMKSWDVEQNQKTAQSLRDGKVNLLFVGNLRPLDCVHDLLGLLEHLVNFIPQVRLILEARSKDEYYVQQLHELCRQKKIDAYVDFYGPSDFGQLKTFYRHAHLFVTMSEAEFFNPSLMDALFFNLPVLAFKNKVNQEILGAAGILFNSKKELFTLAVLIKHLIENHEIRQKLIDAGIRRREATPFAN